MNAVVEAPAYADLGFPIPTPMLDERRRQIEIEGWSAGHDAEHGDGSLLVVAMFYFRHGAGLSLPMRPVSDEWVACKRVPIGWPWAAEWWKPKTPARDLVRAGALCLAEIDRLRKIEPGCDVSVVALVLADIVEVYRALPDPVPS